MPYQSSCIPEQLIRLLRGLGADRQLDGGKTVLDHLIDTHNLISAWALPISVRKAALFSGLPALSFAGAARSEIIEAIGVDVALLSERSGGLARDAITSVMNSSLNGAALAGLTDVIFGCGSDVCHIVLARLLSLAHNLQPADAVERVNTVVSALSPRLAANAYSYYLSSNLGFGLPEDAHEQAQFHFLERLAVSHIDVSPCTHCYATQVFPDSYYTVVRRLARQSSKYKPVPRSQEYEAACRRVLGEPGQRLELWLTDLLKEGPESCDLAGDLNDSFWRAFVKGIVNSISLVAPRFLVSIPDSQLEVALRLVQEKDVAFIAPHLDMRHKPLVIILYLAESEEQEGTFKGTSLYELDPKTDSCIVRKTIPFRPNSAFILPRTDLAFHGVEPHRVHQERATLHIYVQHANARGTRTFQNA